MNEGENEINFCDKYLRVIPYVNFTTLTKFECRNNFLTSLDIDLPQSLVYLDCSYNMIETLTRIPCNLEVLKCNNNSLVEIDTLPISIEILNCSNNKLKKLPINDDNIIKRLNCKYNRLKHIPDFKKATKINCSYNLISLLKNSSPYLLYLHCSNNIIKKLSIKSNLLTYLNCSSNLLKTIPHLKNVEELVCCHNNIKRIKLGKHLILLECCHNEFNSLPLLPPSLTYLKCVENPFNCFIAPIVYNVNMSEIKSIIEIHHKKVNEFKEQARNLISYKLTKFDLSKDLDLMIISYFTCTNVKSINEGINFYKVLINYMI
jgi:hypothetical protein